MPVRIHQDYGRYLLRRGDLWETRKERETRKKKKMKRKKNKRRKKERFLSCPFSCTMKVDVLFSTRRSLAGLLYGDRLRAANGTETRSNATAW